jgi:uncharacterized tellurite resistance protein B-like protein
VACHADADWSAHEQHVVRKIADLLHVRTARTSRRSLARTAAGG